MALIMACMGYDFMRDVSLCMWGTPNSRDASVNNSDCPAGSGSDTSSDTLSENGCSVCLYNMCANLITLRRQIYIIIF